MSKAKFNKLTKLEKEIQELIEKQEQAKKDTYYSIGEKIFKEWNLEKNDNYDLLEEFIKDKAKEFNSLSNEFLNDKTEVLSENESNKSDHFNTI